MPSVGVLELLTILLTAALYVAIPVAIVVLVVRRIRGRSDPALAELRTRYAAGEIDEAEFERRRLVLRGG